jgi:pimeloyl-ACP methyl ester carboxylesterase
MESLTSCDGTRIAYDTRGGGPALIIVDGPLSHQGAGPASALAALLAEHHSVVTYDRRGRGGSSDVTPYAVEREIEDLDALVGAAGGSARVFGISTGGVLALEAARQGVAITALALFEPPFIVARAAPGALVGPLTELVTHGRCGEAVDLYLTRTAALPPDVTAALRRLPFWWSLTAAAHTLVHDAMVMAGTQSGSPLPAGRWAGVGAPVLVLHADGSGADAGAAATALTDVLPHALHKTLPGIHHEVDLADLAHILTAFFGEDPS